MRRLVALAIFASAALLFLVQPLAGRILLPVLGGSPAVWSTCLLFFQAALLLGYLYAHTLSAYAPQRWQRRIHVGLLILASLMLPMPIAIGDPPDADPRPWILTVLTTTVGLPFFALSATAPLLQRWFSETSDPKAGDPYFLYAVSNAGSLMGLLGYLLVEPVATRGVQTRGWSIGFWACAALIVACAAATLRRTPTRTPAARAATSSALPLSRYALWIGLALVPSALLLGVTQHLATDVASVPLLWAVPLALYLTTYMAAFSTRGFWTARRWGVVAPPVILLVLVLSLGEIRYPILLIALAHLAAFTVLAMLCHTRLAESRPDPGHLTGYFVCLSLGGVLGSAAAALVAPIVFSSILEYPLAIAAAILLRPQTVQADRMANSPFVRWALRGGAAILLVAGYWAVSAFNARANMEQLTSSALKASFAVPAALLLLTPRAALLFAGTATGLLLGGAVIRTGGEVLLRERTFFGVHQVTSIQHGDWHVLTHGTTTHGLQAVRGKVHLLPTAYYHPSGPIGDLVFTLAPEGRFHDVAVIGLGTGALAAYAGSGTRMDFFEIDEAVISIAEDPRFFTYLSDARARPGTTIRTTAVDGRVGIRAMPASSYDLVVIDAFSSDAIPTHLITREAIAMYISRLKPRGVIAVHVSSRFFDLRGILARIASSQGLRCYARDDAVVPPERAGEGVRPSVWVVVARAEQDVGQIAQAAPRWLRLVPDPSDAVWTDDYVNVLATLRF